MHWLSFCLMGSKNKTTKSSSRSSSIDSSHLFIEPVTVIVWPPYRCHTGLKNRSEKRPAWSLITWCVIQSMCQEPQLGPCFKQAQTRTHHLENPIMYKVWGMRGDWSLVDKPRGDRPSNWSSHALQCTERRVFLHKYIYGKFLRVS